MMPNYHWFNIGRLDGMSHQEWWDYLRRERILAVGFENKRSHIGKSKITGLAEGDIILAYASKFGPIGYGDFGPKSSYRQVEKGVRSDMRHQRNVRWKATIDDLIGSNPSRDWLSKFGLKTPPQGSLLH
jgi:hypothetical protein